jgi:L-asparaginase / beta-aspartyl-peptidase
LLCVKIVVVHGGVSGVPKEQPDLTECARIQGAGESALDLIEDAVVALEEHPLLNAGYGATLNRDGEVELDAAIAGSGRHGGVVSVRVRNPIRLARRVLEATPHILIGGRGAMELGADLEILERTTEEQEERYRKARKEGRLADYAAPEFVDTVGAVALDESGSLAAGSSTGGVFGKLPGRIGDSAIPGAGTYASLSAAVVGTGVGEAFLDTLACFRVARLIEDGVSPQEACERTIAFIAETHDVSAGLLALDRDGNIGIAFRGGSWAVAKSECKLDAVKLD